MRGGRPTSGLPVTIMHRDNSRAASGNLPAELSSFVGRQGELRDIKQLMATGRLVTLTGIGGVGKTRLAQRVATEIRRAFPDGAWFAGLAELVDGIAEQPDPDRLAQLVGVGLGVRDQAATRSVAALAAHLDGRRMLLVLDNCEHVSASAAALVTTLLRRCTDLRVIATSREPLAVPGELVFPVAPLPTPHASGVPNGKPLDGYESVGLFLARAATAVPGFALTADNGPAIAGICRRVDGLPLAIELAAAWLPVLAPRQILDRLEDRFALLSRGNRGAPERQQTLRASIDWSYHLCTPAERRLWLRLCVFAGGFELDAVEGVCADAELPAEDVLDVITGLLDKSVLVRCESGPAARYRMLQFVRAYAQEQLRAQGDEPRLRGRHRDWYERLVGQARAEWLTPRQPSWLSRLAREHANIRAAAEWCLSEPDGAHHALRIALSLPPLYWAACGLIPETRHWLDRALRQDTAAREDRLRALTVACVLAGLQGDQEAVAAWEREAQGLAEQLGTDHAHALYDHAAGAHALYGGDPVTAVARYLKALAVFRAADDVEMQLRTLNPLAVACGVTGDTVLAAACAEEVIAMTPTGEVWHRSIALTNLGVVRWRQGQRRQATEILTECLELRRLVDDPLGTAWCLETLAWIAAQEGDATRAATLFGAARGLSEAVGAPSPTHPSIAADHDTWEEHTRQALGVMAFEAAFRRGAGLDAGAAIRYALRAEPGPTGTPDAAQVVLTRREREVAELIAAGLTNKEIATRLVISRRTAESHVEHILAKLAFSSRAQVAAWAAGQTQTR